MPLTGPAVAGPLGVAHLPRMWLKSVLSAAGVLYDGYTDDDKGFNKRVCEGLGLEAGPWFAYLRTMPTYSQAEGYVRAHATKLDDATIAAVTNQVRTLERPEDAAAPLRARAGIHDPTLRTSASLIDADDRQTVHEQFLAHRGETIEPLVPMVSSSQAGTLGIAHLPRLWMKAFSHALGALPPEWKTGTGCGFDCFVATTIGLDIAEASAYIASELPTEVQFESWVAERIGHPDAATAARWSHEIRTREKNATQAAADVAEAEAPGTTSLVAALLNDLVDWKHMHAYAVARAASADLTRA